MHYRILCLLIVAGCAGGTKEVGPTPESPYAGTYQTVVELVSNTCTGITVQNNPTTVRHQPGQTALTLTHGPLEYSGSVAADGTFSLQPRSVTAGNQTHTLTITGRFTGRTLNADVAVVVTTPGAANCTYNVRWAGSR